MSYKAWGEAREVISEAAKAAGITNPLRFQEQYYDAEIGAHYNRYRYHDPLAGRFISKDLIGRQGGINFYEYAPNPTEWIDPLGLSNYTFAPKHLPVFPDAISVKRKTPVQGGGMLRKRWRLGDGCICEWDSQHGEVEKYDRRGNHLGAYDPESGDAISGKGPIAKRKMEP